MIKHYAKYITTLKADEDILETYRELRRAFRREGWTEKDLEKPPYYPNDIMKNFQKFSSLHSKLFEELKGFFPDIDHNEFVEYLKNKMALIDLEIPLKNGDKKRTDNPLGELFSRNKFEDSTNKNIKSEVIKLNEEPKVINNTKFNNLLQNRETQKKEVVTTNNIEQKKENFGSNTNMAKNTTISKKPVKPTGSSPLTNIGKEFLKI